jgi:hypothetical protein
MTFVSSISSPCKERIEGLLWCLSFCFIYTVIFVVHYVMTVIPFIDCEGIIILQVLLSFPPKSARLPT